MVWLRFAALWFAVVLIGFLEGYVLVHFGLAAFLGAVFLTAFVVWRIALVALSLVSMWKESHYGQPVKGSIWFTLAILGSVLLSFSPDTFRRQDP